MEDVLVVHVIATLWSVTAPREIAQRIVRITPLALTASCVNPSTLVMLPAKIVKVRLETMFTMNNACSKARVFRLLDKWTVKST